MNEQRVAAAGDAGMERTESGLIVPTGTVEKPRHRWTWDDWKKIDRGFKALIQGGGIVALLACTKCGKRLAAKPTARGFEMECLCTIHEITRR